MAAVFGTAIVILPVAERERLTRLNDGQRAAVERVLSAEDYALVLGLPGTGKTTLVGAATRATKFALNEMKKLFKREDDF